MGNDVNRLERQSFLGADSDRVLAGATLGIIGAGGGGSHMVQQFAHSGIGGFIVVDPDVIDLTNTNRLVGGTLADADAKLPKIEIAERMVRGLQHEPRLRTIKLDWRLALDELKDCDVLLGAVDSFKDRDQLERFARRFLIPYIDIGMDVLALGEQEFLINGQVILSIAGGPCLRCCNFITDERLAHEAENYGAAGSRPQVVWSNGVLASTAVGIAIELLTPWHRSRSGFIYLEYDGNQKTVSVSPWVRVLESCVCPHYRRDETGDPGVDIRSLLDKQAPLPMTAPVKRQRIAAAPQKPRRAAK
jgi:molybdopterin/thiamine biosynthesis adenylyltransferase